MDQSNDLMEVSAHPCSVPGSAKKLPHPSSLQDLQDSKIYRISNGWLKASPSMVVGLGSGRAAGSGLGAAGAGP